MAPSGPGGPKPKQQYNYAVKKLEAQLSHQETLIQQTKEQMAREEELQHVLADGICQQKVINELVIPLHKHWLEHPNADTVHTQWLSAAHGRWGCSAQGWSTLMGLVCSCNPMLAGISKATPQLVHYVMAMTKEELLDIHSQLIMELVMLLELSSPDRYHGEDLDSLARKANAQKAAAEAPGAGAAAALAQVPGSISTDVAALEMEAQAAASAILQARARMLECTEQSIVLGGLLVLHRPDLILEMCTTNCSTKQPCVPPAGHFVKAANRLALNQQQLTHLRLMLQHYNRSLQRQLEQGLGLLQLSEDSVGLQAQAAGLSSTQSGSRTQTGSGPGGSASGAAAGASNGHRAAAAGSQSGSSARGKTLRSNAAAAARQPQPQPQPQPSIPGPQAAQQGRDGEAEDGGPDLADRLQQHLQERMQVMQLMGFWVANTLSTTQFAKFLVYSWPYYPLCSALAEASSLLLPDPDVSTTEVQDAEAFMRWRCRGMAAEFKWLSQHVGELRDGGPTAAANTAGLGATL